MSEETDKIRILEAEKVYRPSIRDWLIAGFGQADWDEVRAFVWSFVPPTDAMPSLLADIDRWEKDGKRPHEVIVRENPRRTLRNELLYASARYIGQANELTWIGSRLPMADTTNTLAWANLSPAFWLAPFEGKKERGGYLTIHGSPRRGKTGLACSILELWLEAHPGCEVLTNIPLLKAVPRVREATEGSSLAAGIAAALIAGRRWHWAWDEPNLSKYGRSDAATTVSHNLNRFARIIPKLGGSLTYIEHLEEGVPSVIQAFAEYHVICERPGFVLADMAQKISVRQVPLPKVIQYRTGQPGYFDLEDGFNWDGFFHALKFHPGDISLDEEDASEQGRRILDFLEKEKTKPPKRGPGRPRKDETAPEVGEERSQDATPAPQP